MRSKRLVLTALLLGPLALGGAWGAQPADDVDARRARVERFLAEIAEAGDTAREALAALETGAELDDVMAGFPRLGALMAGGAERRFEGRRGMRRGLGGRDLAEHEPALDGAQLERIDAFVRERLPELAERLDRAGRFDERARERMLRRMAPRLIELRLLAERDRPAAEARVTELESGLAVISAARDLRMALRTGEGEDGARAALRGALGAHFDARAAVRRLEIERVSAELDRLRAELSDQLARRDALIDAKMDEVEAGPGPR